MTLRSIALSPFGSEAEANRNKGKADSHVPVAEATDR
jgi:hypothetical protein